MTQPARNPQTGSLTPSKRPTLWTDIFKALDAAGFPEDFLAEPTQGQAPECRRVPLTHSCL